MRFFNLLFVTFIVISLCESGVARDKSMNSHLIGEYTPVWLVNRHGVVRADENIIARAVQQYEGGVLKKKHVKRDVESPRTDGTIGTLKSGTLQHRNATLSKNTVNDEIVYKLNRIKKHNGSIRSKSPKSADDTVYPEILIIGRLLTEFISTHDARLLNYLVYLIKFWNSVNLRFRTLTNPRIHLRITGIIINVATIELPFISNNIDKTARIKPKSIPDMSTWIKTMNLINNHEYDIAIAMTDMKLCGYDPQKKKCITWRKVMARRYSNANCSFKERSVAMIKDNYQFSGIPVAAKTIGHLFGAVNDYNEGLEDCFDKDRYIMSWRVDYGKKNFEWSPCSQRSIQKYFRFNSTQCFRNKKPHRNQGNPVKELLPGEKISIEAQCAANGYGAGCQSKNICDNLRCRHKLWFCFYVGDPAFDGTPCGNGGICRNGVCET